MTLTGSLSFVIIKLIKFTNGECMKYQGSTQSNVKLKNQELILKLLLAEGPMTRADLAKKMNSSKPTISKNVEDLLVEKKVIEIGKDDNMVGKKGTLLDMNADYGYVLALDLSKNKFRAVIANLKEEWIDTCSISLEEYMADGDIKQADVLVELKSFLDGHRDKWSKMMYAIISYSGVVGHNDELYLTNLKYKETVLKDLVPYIREDLALPLSIKNDVNLAVLAEKKYGAFGDRDNLYLLSADIGVGVGIIIDNHLYEGDRNAAGEVGFVLPIPDSDGSYKTLEERVSLHALAGKYRSISDVTMKYEDLIEAVEGGEPGALKIYEDVLRDLSITITNIASILDIGTVVVVGRLFNLKSTMIDDLNDLIKKMTPFDTIVYQTNLDKMSLRGAVVIGVERVISQMV